MPEVHDRLRPHSRSAEVYSIVGNLLVYLRDVRVRLPRRGDTELQMDYMYARRNVGCIVPVIPERWVSTGLVIDSCVSVKAVLDTGYARTATAMTSRERVGGHDKLDHGHLSSRSSLAAFSFIFKSHRSFAAFSVDEIAPSPSRL